MPHDDTPQRWNRDDQQKPAAPPRSASEPPGAEGSARSPKTQTDPATGEPRPRPPRPNQAQADEAETLD